VDKYRRQNLARVTIDGPSSEDEQGGDQDEDEDEDEDMELVDLGESEDSLGKKTCKEAMASHVHTLRDFCDGIEYQLQFQDQRFLKTLEREGGRFFRLAENCLSWERRLNSSQMASPATWERATSNALFYRARPRDDHST